MQTVTLLTMEQKLVSLCPAHMRVPHSLAVCQEPLTQRCITQITGMGITNMISPLGCCLGRRMEQLEALHSLSTLRHGKQTTYPDFPLEPGFSDH